MSEGPKLLLDMNLSPRWVTTLQEAGFETTHWSAVGDLAAADADIAAYAVRAGMAVVTNDLDFGFLLSASGDSGPSVVQIRAEDLSPEALGERLVAALRQAAADLLDGALITVDAERVRLRLLPIRRHGRDSSGEDA